MLLRLLVAGFLLAHAAIHIGFVSPRPPATAGGPPWPFTLDHSWLLSPLGMGPDALRLMGLALFAVLLGGYAVAAIAAIGWLPSGAWVAGVVIGSAASLALLLAFFHPWLVLGVLIDLVLIWAVLAADWVPEPA
ncbi:MAG TPA: hypothetical protein VFH63_03050 [candidate division Zixibacteria bacterium]|nr:hypothetical protein [candidate division Zixibacteria bacterium]